MVCLGDDFAESFFKAGQRAEKAGDKFHAFLLYSRAAALQPANVEYAMRKAALQADAAMSAKTRLDRRPLADEHEELSRGAADGERDSGGSRGADAAAAQRDRTG